MSEQTTEGAVAYATIGEAAEATATQQHEDQEGVERDADSGVITAVSLCMECGENGSTTFLPTVIPHFKRVVVSSFRCDECGHRNTECMIADYGEKGCRYVLKATGPADRPSPAVTA